MYRKYTHAASTTMKIVKNNGPLTKKSNRLLNSALRSIFVIAVSTCAYIKGNLKETTGEKNNKCDYAKHGKRNRQMAHFVFSLLVC